MTPAAKKTTAAAPAEDNPATAQRNADVAALSYETARDELVSIVARLEGGQVGLEESMRLWERGEALADRCAAWLDGAERRLRRDEAGGTGPADDISPVGGQAHPAEPAGDAGSEVDDEPADEG